MTRCGCHTHDTASGDADRFVPTRLAAVAMVVLLFAVTVCAVLVVVVVEAQPLQSHQRAKEAYLCSPEDGGAESCVAQAFRSALGDASLFDTSLDTLQQYRLPPHCSSVYVRLPRESASAPSVGTDDNLIGAGIYPFDVDLRLAALHSGLIASATATEEQTAASDDVVVLRVTSVSTRRAFYAVTNNSITSSARAYPLGTIGVPAILIERGTTTPPRSNDRSDESSTLGTKTEEDHDDDASARHDEEEEIGLLWSMRRCLSLPNHSTPLLLPREWVAAIQDDFVTTSTSANGPTANSRRSTAAARRHFFREAKANVSVVGSGPFSIISSDAFAAFWLSAASDGAWLADVSGRSTIDIGDFLQWRGDTMAPPHPASPWMTSTTTSTRENNDAAAEARSTFIMGPSPAAGSRALLLATDIGSAPYFLTTSIAGASRTVARGSATPAAVGIANSSADAAFVFRWVALLRNWPLMVDIAPGFVPAPSLRAVTVGGGDPGSAAAYQAWFPVIVGPQSGNATEGGGVVGAGEYAAHTSVTAAAIVSGLCGDFSRLFNAPPPETADGDGDSSDALITMVLVRFTGFRPQFYSLRQHGFASRASGRQLGFVISRASRGAISSLLILPNSPQAIQDRVAAGAFGPYVTMVPNVAIESLATALEQQRATGQSSDAILTGTAIYLAESTDVAAASFHHGLLLNVGQRRDLFVHLASANCSGRHFYRSTYLGVTSSYRFFVSPLLAASSSITPPNVAAFSGASETMEAWGCFTVAATPTVPEDHTRLDPRRLVLRLTHHPGPNIETLSGAGVYGINGSLDVTAAAFHANVLPHNVETIVYAHEAAPRNLFYSNTFRGIRSSSVWLPYRRSAAVYFSLDSQLPRSLRSALDDPLVTPVHIFPLGVPADYAVSAPGVVQGVGYYSRFSDIASAAVHGTHTAFSYNTTVFVYQLPGVRRHFLSGYSNGVRATAEWFHPGVPAFAVISLVERRIVASSSSAGGGTAATSVTTESYPWPLTLSPVTGLPNYDDVVQRVPALFESDSTAGGNTTNETSSTIAATSSPSDGSNGNGADRETSSADEEEQTLAARRRITIPVVCNTVSENAFQTVVGTGHYAWASDVTAAAVNSFMIYERDGPQFLTVVAFRGNKSCFPWSRSLAVRASASTFQSTPTFIVYLSTVTGKPATDKIKDFYDAAMTAAALPGRVVAMSAYVGHHLNDKVVGAVYYDLLQSEFHRAAAHAGHIDINDEPVLLQAECESFEAKAYGAAGSVPENSTDLPVFSAEQTSFLSIFNNSILSSGGTTAGPRFFFVPSADSAVDRINVELRASEAGGWFTVAVQIVAADIPSHIPPPQGTELYGVGSEVTLSALHCGKLNWNETAIVYLRTLWTATAPGCGDPLLVPGSTSFYHIASQNAAFSCAHTLIMHSPADAWPILKDTLRVIVFRSRHGTVAACCGGLLVSCDVANPGDADFTQNALQQGLLRFGVPTTLFLHFVVGRTTVGGDTPMTWRHRPWPTARSGYTSYGLSSCAIDHANGRYVNPFVLSTDGNASRLPIPAVNDRTGLFDASAVFYVDIVVPSLTMPRKGGNILRGSGYYHPNTDVTLAALHSGLVFPGDMERPCVRIYYRLVDVVPPQPLFGTLGYNGLRSESDGQDFSQAMIISRNATAAAFAAGDYLSHVCGLSTETFNAVRQILSSPFATCVNVPYPLSALWPVIDGVFGTGLYAVTSDLTMAARHAGLYHEAAAALFNASGRHSRDSAQVVSSRCPVMDAALPGGNATTTAAGLDTPTGANDWTAALVHDSWNPGTFHLRVVISRRLSDELQRLGRKLPVDGCGSCYGVAATPPTSKDRSVGASPSTPSRWGRKGKCIGAT